MGIQPSKTRSAPGAPSESFIRSLSEQRNEPDWMTQFRCECLSLYKNQTGPSSSVDPVESRLRFDQRTAFLNDRTQHEDPSPSDDPDRVVELKKQGVYVRPLREAICERPEMVREHFMQQAVTPDQSRLTALHGTFWNSGTFVYVPENVHVELPLTVFHRNTSETRFLFPHQLIVAEPGARLRFVEGCSAPAADQTETVTGGVELLVGSNASVRYSTMQNWGADAVNVTEKRAILNRNASVEWISGNIGSRHTEMIPTTVLNGPGASCKHLDFSLASDGQTLRSGARIHHRAPDTRSRATLRTAAFAGGNATSICDVTAEPGSHGSVSDVTNDARMLDQTACAVTRNELQINEKQVELRQNGTASNLSPEHQFYLQSRGIPRSRARLTLLNGFLHPVMNAVPTEFAVELRKQIRRMFD